MDKQIDNGKFNTNLLMRSNDMPDISKGFFDYVDKAART